MARIVLPPVPHTLVCHSIIPYPTKRGRRGGDATDDFFQKVVYAVKDIKNVQDPKTGNWYDPYDAVASWMAKHPRKVAGVLVPCPRHTVGGTQGTPAARVANALVQANLATHVAHALHRSVEVTKSSAHTKQEERTTVEEHVASIAVDRRSLANAKTIMIVDDVLTSGTQLMGVMQVIERSGYAGRIFALTVGHTVTDPSDDRDWHVEHTISWATGATHARRVRP